MFRKMWPMLSTDYNILFEKMLFVEIGNKNSINKLLPGTFFLLCFINDQYWTQNYRYENS